MDFNFKLFAIVFPLVFVVVFGVVMAMSKKKT